MTRSGLLSVQQGADACAIRVCCEELISTRLGTQGFLLADVRSRMVAPNRIQFVTFRNANAIDLVLLANDTFKLRRGGRPVLTGRALSHGNGGSPVEIEYV